MKKRLLAGLLLVTMVIGLVGCGGDTEIEEDICLSAPKADSTHQWSEATCTEPEHCTWCGETRGDPLGHQWQEASCTEPERCARCGGVRGDPKGHAVETWSVVKTPTCSETGAESGICSVCGETTNKVLHKTDHTPGDWEITKEGTATEKGMREQRCTVCGAVIQEETFAIDGYTDPTTEGQEPASTQAPEVNEELSVAFVEAIKAADYIDWRDCLVDAEYIGEGEGGTLWLIFTRDIDWIAFNKPFGYESIANGAAMNLFAGISPELVILQYETGEVMYEKLFQ